MAYTGKRRYGGNSNYGNKRPRKAYYKTKGRSVPVPRSLSIPGKARSAVVLNYTDMQTLSGAAASNVSRQVYRLNSLFDPDATGAGAQPSGFDQYAAIYNRYTVFKVDVEAHFSAINSTTLTGTYSAGFFGANNDPSTTTSLVNALSRSDKMSIAAASGGGLTTRVLKQTYYLPALAGKPYKVGDSSYSAVTTASPGNDLWLHVWAGGATDIATPDGAYLLLRLRFYCIFSEPRSLNES